MNFYRQKRLSRITETEKRKRIRKTAKTFGDWLSEGTEGIMSFVFAGVLLGLMPMWNGAIFVAAFAVIAVLFVLFPQRRQLVAMGIAVAILSLPQVIYLENGRHARSRFSKTLHWGYTLGDHTAVLDVVKYLAWTFGFKWLLIAIALIVGTSFRRRLFLAMCSLIVLTFCFQFSLEVMTNHKFLNLWVVVAKPLCSGETFVGYGISRY